MTRRDQPRTLGGERITMLTDTTRVERHALSLVKQNEDLPDFSVGGLLFALNRYHDRKTIERVVTRMLTNNTLTEFNGRLILTEDDENE